MSGRADRARNAADPGHLPQVFDLVVQPETRMVIDRLAERRGESPSETASRLLHVGMQAELVRQRWLGGMRSLSPRQREAALVLLGGGTYKVLAAKMKISYWTANDYAQHAIRAFGQMGEMGLWRKYALLLDLFPESDLVPGEEPER